MTIRTLVVYPNTFVDSVLQMSATRAMEDSNGVLWAAAAMSLALPSALSLFCDAGGCELALLVRVGVFLRIPTAPCSSASFGLSELDELLASFA